MNSLKVLIDPRTNIEYASFYIYGLYQVFGKRNVTFSKKPFKELKGFEHFLAIFIDDGFKEKKIIIDYTDSKHINKAVLCWCDVYGKINITSSDIKTSSKLIAIGPSFGIKLFNLSQTLFYGLYNFIISFNELKARKQFLSSYKAQYKRPLISVYKHQEADENYIFFLSSLWKDEPQTNKFRSNFIKSCLSIDELHFEGGFVPRSLNDIKGFEIITTKRRLSAKEYFYKIKKSTLVFNTAAVKDCHGWKLAEYLALGKAIVSTPFTRKLPEPLLNGETFISTDGTIEDLTKKVKQLLMQPNLIKALEANSSSYYNKHLKPSVVINRLLNFNPIED